MSMVSSNLPSWSWSTSAARPRPRRRSVAAALLTTSQVATLVCSLAANPRGQQAAHLFVAAAATSPTKNAAAVAAPRQNPADALHAEAAASLAEADQREAKISGRIFPASPRRVDDDDDELHKSSTTTPGEGAGAAPEQDEQVHSVPTSLLGGKSPEEIAAEEERVEQSLPPHLRAELQRIRTSLDFKRGIEQQAEKALQAHRRRQLEMEDVAVDAYWEIRVWHEAALLPRLSSRARDRRGFRAGAPPALPIALRGGSSLLPHFSDFASRLFQRAEGVWLSTGGEVRKLPPRWLWAETESRGYSLTDASELASTLLFQNSGAEGKGMLLSSVGKSSFVCDRGLRVLDGGAQNDDYCDCEDGTDEPATSACSGVPPLLEQHARNLPHGHVARMRRKFLHKKYGLPFEQEGARILEEVADERRAMELRAMGAGGVPAEQVRVAAGAVSVEHKNGTRQLVEGASNEINEWHYPNGTIWRENRVTKKQEWFWAEGRVPIPGMPQGYALDTYEVGRADGELQSKMDADDREGVTNVVAPSVMRRAFNFVATWAWRESGFPNLVQPLPEQAAASAHFVCPQAGSLPRELFRSRVNDGICDCCDGADETASGTVCGENTCRAEGAEIDRLAKKVNADFFLREKSSSTGEGLEKEAAQGGGAAELREIMGEVPQLPAGLRNSSPSLWRALHGAEEIDPRRHADREVRREGKGIIEELKKSSTATKKLSPKGKLLAQKAAAHLGGLMEELVGVQKRVAEQRARQAKKLKETTDRKSDSGEDAALPARSSPEVEVELEPSRTAKADEAPESKRKKRLLRYLKNAPPEVQQQFFWLHGNAAEDKFESVEPLFCVPQHDLQPAEQPTESYWEDGKPRESKAALVPSVVDDGGKNGRASLSSKLQPRLFVNVATCDRLRSGDSEVRAAGPASPAAGTEALFRDDQFYLKLLCATTCGMRAQAGPGGAMPMLGHAEPAPMHCLIGKTVVADWAEALRLLQRQHQLGSMLQMQAKSQPRDPHSNPSQHEQALVVAAQQQQFALQQRRELCVATPGGKLDRELFQKRVAFLNLHQSVQRWQFLAGMGARLARLWTETVRGLDGRVLGMVLLDGCLGKIVLQYMGSTESEQWVRYKYEICFDGTVTQTELPARGAEDARGAGDEEGAGGNGAKRIVLARALRMEEADHMTMTYESLEDHLGVDEAAAAVSPAPRLAGLWFVDGDACPGIGPRMAKAVFTCGPRIELLDVKETSTCVYQFHFMSPGGCGTIHRFRANRYNQPETAYNMRGPFGVFRHMVNLHHLPPHISSKVQVDTGKVENLLLRKLLDYDPTRDAWNLLYWWLVAQRADLWLQHLTLRDLLVGVAETGHEMWGWLSAGWQAARDAAHQMLTMVE